MDERLGAVDRVEDPAAGGAGGAGEPELLAQDGVVGEASLDARAQELFGAAVGDRHRGEIGLGLDLDPGLVVGQRRASRLVGDLDREVEQLA